MDSPMAEQGRNTRGSGTTYRGRHTRCNRRDLILSPDTDTRGAPPEPDEQVESKSSLHLENRTNDSSNDSHDQRNYPNDLNDRLNDSQTTRTLESSVPPKVTQEWSSIPITYHFDLT